MPPLPAALLAGAGWLVSFGAGVGPDEGGWPSLHGDGGLATIPTAEVVPDGVVQVVGAWIPARHNPEGFHGSDDVVLAARVGFLPRLEVMGRVTWVRGLPFTAASYGDDKDRLVGARLLVLRESARVPAVALGVRDAAGSSRRFHAAYVAIRKSFALPGPAGLDLHLHGGWAPSLMEAASRVLEGPFGAVELRGRGPVSLAMELDGSVASASIATALLSGRLHLRLAALGLDSLGAAAGIGMQLG
jgi:hypothetical protein